SGGVGVPLDPFLKPEGPSRGRAQVAHAAAENNFWVLANGKLRRLEVVRSTAEGPKVLPARDWPALPLGSAQHASQVFEHDFEGPGSKNVTIVLVTQAPDRHASLATAVDAETGKVRWQRQLGLVCRGAPLVLGKDVLAHDQGGGLFLFNSDRYQGHFDEWPVGGTLVGPGLEDGPGLPPTLLAGPDGASAYQVACPGKGTQIVVRRFQP